METIVAYKTEKKAEHRIRSRSNWKRIVLLWILGYEGLGCLVGGTLLVMEPTGKLMDMPVDIMQGVFLDFLIPGIILLGLGILNIAAWILVLREKVSDWVVTGLALGGLVIWFWVEIAILEQLHWLHAMWGLPVVAGALLAISYFSTK